MDVVVTVPKTFTHPAAPGKRGLAAWLAEGDAPGEEWTGLDWEFTTWGFRPKILPGERVYVVCEGRLVGYAPLTELYCEFDGGGPGRVMFVRAGGAVACTIPEKITGFRGWRTRWWDRADEVPLDLSAYLPAPKE
jgi:hypothetical protein